AKTYKAVHPQPFVGHGRRVLPHPAGADGMVGGGAAAADEIEQLVVALALIAGLDLLGDMARHGWCAEDAPQCLGAGDDGLSVLLGRRSEERRVGKEGGLWWWAGGGRSE